MFSRMAQYVSGLMDIAPDFSSLPGPPPPKHRSGGYRQKRRRALARQRDRR